LLQAVLFDLDGTLLPMNHKEFIAEYVKELSGAVMPVIETEHFARTLRECIGATVNNLSPDLTNAEVFWANLEARLGNRTELLKPLVKQYYAERFHKLGRLARPSSEARAVVEAILARGKRIVLATNPLFPLSAIRDRMAWAGVADLPWELITSYENMHFCKPHPEYYLEIARKLKIEPGECLMVGNDTQTDLVAKNVGMKTYIVTDYLIGSTEEAAKADGYGKLSSLRDWCRLRLK
jgi:FMN phosphatase YigB (HAD superfamily)